MFNVLMFITTVDGSQQLEFGETDRSNNTEAKQCPAFSGKNKQHITIKIMHPPP